ncbi:MULTISPECIES: hypothetical protein [unclassified Modestobacter]
MTWFDPEAASFLAARQLAEEARHRRHQPLGHRPRRRRPDRLRSTPGRPAPGECAAAVVDPHGDAGPGDRY